MLSPEMTDSAASPARIPVLLLKTKSTPADNYEDYFSQEPFRPIFVPVLEHRLITGNLDIVRSLLTGGGLGRGANAKYGGLIFTSQRAVEAFANVLREVEEQQKEEGEEEDMRSAIPASNTTVNSTSSSSSPAPPASTAPPSPCFPFYTVGPATSRSLNSLVSQSPSLQRLHPSVLGSSTGNGEALAHFILRDYNDLHDSASASGPPPPKAPLLFLTGEQRRDIISTTLTDTALPPHQPIAVDELPVYETAVLPSFERDLAAHVCAIEAAAIHPAAAVVVVFSPTACGAMLRCLGFVGSDSSSSPSAATSEDEERGIDYLVATIGPTTRDHLRREWGFEPDVCAARPSPEGVGEAVRAVLLRREAGETPRRRRRKKEGEEVPLQGSS